MTAKLLKGKDVADKIDLETKAKVEKLNEAGITPLLGLIRVGNKEADLAYEKSIKKRLEKVGVKVFVMELGEKATGTEIVRLLNVTNNNADISGVMVFRPLPEAEAEKSAADAISSVKDVDGMNPLNQAKVFSGEPGGFAPCTAEAAVDILKYNGIETKGKRVAVVGRSLVIGRPVAAMLTSMDATVTLCHSKTENLGEILRESDIVIAAVGKSGFITKDMIKPGATVIDVGINVDEEGHLTGDVAKDAADVAGAMTPVPGGVGSVTTSVLALHTAIAAEKLQSMAKAHYSNRPAGKNNKQVGKVDNPAGKVKEPAEKAENPAGKVIKPAEKAENPAGNVIEPAGKPKNTDDTDEK